jgi:hypothetical protein
MKNKAYHIITYINLFIIISSGLLAGYWYFIDELVRPPLTFNVDIQNFELDKEEYTQGEDVRVKTSFCKNIDGLAEVSWNIVDTIVRTYPTKVAQLPKGCYGEDEPVWAKIVTLPPDISAGYYFMTGVSRVRLNPLKVVEYKYKTQPFTVYE